MIKQGDKKQSIGLLIRMIAAALIILIGWPDNGLAWSRKGHVLIVRSAIKMLLADPTTPAPYQNLLREGVGDVEKLNQLETLAITQGNRDVYTGIDFYSYRPDELVTAKSTVPGFQSTEELMHYLNIEDFHPDPNRRKFLPDGSNKIRLKDLPKNPQDPRYQVAGMVTFRVEQCYRSLVESLRDNYTNEQAFLWLGYLSHYLSDAYQPFHSSIDYQGFDCPCNLKQKEQGKEPHNFHKDLESTLFASEHPDAPRWRAQFWQHYSAALKNIPPPPANNRLDAYLLTQQALLSGYDYLPMLCRAGQASLINGEFKVERWFNYREKVGEREISVLQLKAERMAQATAVISGLFRQAWQDAQASNQKKFPKN